jgi:hypothetical protein
VRLRGPPLAQISLLGEAPNRLVRVNATAVQTVQRWLTVALTEVSLSREGESED